MSDRKLKALTYRVEGIPPGTTEVTLIQEHFHEEDQQYLVVKSLCPSVDETDELTATVLFHPPEVPEGGPRYHDHHISVDPDFNGLTPLYVPKDKRHIDAEYVIFHHSYVAVCCLYNSCDDTITARHAVLG